MYIIFRTVSKPLYETLVPGLFFLEIIIMLVIMKVLSNIKSHQNTHNSIKYKVI